MAVRNFLTLDDVRFDGKRVLVRADLNVPVSKTNGAVTDATRLQRLAPTLRDLRAQGAKIIILSHFGRPDGQRNPKYSLKPIADALANVLNLPIAFAEDCKGPAAAEAVARLDKGGILVLENTRFHAGEEANDPALAQEMAALGDVIVYDAFSAAHRAHASTEGMMHYLPAVAGRLMQAELDALDQALENPKRPVAAIVGGAKISTKLDLLINLVNKVDIVVLGGGMANTFLAAQGKQLGKSLVESDMLDQARTIMQKAEARGCHILLPKDAVVAAELKEGVATATVTTASVPADQMILDIGPAAIKEIVESLQMCKTIVWNGPMGVFEVPPFDRGTREIAIAVADLTKRGAVISVAGGGETVAAINACGQNNGLTYVSAAGGAFLEWLEGKELPGVAALRQARQKVAAKAII